MFTEQEQIFSNQMNEEKIISKINKKIVVWNKDNITRTKAYANFFNTYPEIKWSFLASMVSRNAGWNMCDLEGYWFKKALPIEYRRTLFLTYELANWMIFQDAFPQLLLYHYSTKYSLPLFHLCRKFDNSKFIENEWFYFWRHKDENRLNISLIINEQNVIQKPVLEDPFYKSKVFDSFFYLIQDWLHFSTVLFPTANGALFGSSVHSFRNVDNRIKLGKTLSAILFAPNLFPQFYQFSLNTEHTGSRHDYEQYFAYKKKRETPFLRTVFPIVPHNPVSNNIWDERRKIKKKWFKIVNLPKKAELTNWYKMKQKQQEAGVVLTNLLTKKQF